MKETDCELSPTQARDVIQRREEFAALEDTAEGSSTGADVWFEKFQELVEGAARAGVVEI